MNSFELLVLTPEREFFSGQAESLVFQTTDGEYCILAGHQPSLMAVNVGILKIYNGENTIVAFCSEGFVEIAPEKTIIFSQSCEWPDEIDTARAEKAREHAEEKLRHVESVSEHKYSTISLARAITRIKVKNYYKK